MKQDNDTLRAENARLRNQLESVRVALEFYSNGQHFDVVDGRTRIIDTGDIAEEAIKCLNDPEKC